MNQKPVCLKNQFASHLLEDAASMQGARHDTTVAFQKLHRALPSATRPAVYSVRARDTNLYCMPQLQPLGGCSTVREAHPDAPHAQIRLQWAIQTPAHESARQDPKTGRDGTPFECRRHLVTPNQEAGRV